MNQIEFIKKWGKHGDRIIDGEFKAIITQDESGAIYYHFFDPEESDGFNFHCVDNYNAHRWQSPKIYRLKDTSDWSCLDETGYSERWQLIADYADEKRDEKLEKLDEVYEKLSTRCNPLEEDFKEIFKLVESRLKALEDKI